MPQVAGEDAYWVDWDMLDRQIGGWTMCVQATRGARIVLMQHEVRCCIYSEGVV